MEDERLLREKGNRLTKQKRRARQAWKRAVKGFFRRIRKLPDEQDIFELENEECPNKK